MFTNIELKEQPAQPVLSVRSKTSVEQMPAVLGTVYGAIMQHLGALGEQPAGPPFVAYYNMDMQNLDIEVGFPVAAHVTGADELKRARFQRASTSRAFSSDRTRSL